VGFGLQSRRGALAVIVLLWGAIAATVAHYRRHSRAAALLLLPYFAWVSFAAYLNAESVRLNDGSLLP
jgi:benzodiazapine receptor